MDSNKHLLKISVTVGILAILAGCVSAYVPPPLAQNHPANPEVQEGKKPDISLRDPFLEEVMLNGREAEKKETKNGHAHHGMNHGAH